MTDPFNPSHDEPAEGPRDADFSGGSGAETARDAAGDAASGTSAKANEMFDQFKDAVSDFAERAAPTVREYSARAAEFVAVAADKAGPLAAKAGTATADASTKLASNARHWAEDVREPTNGHDVADAATDAAKDVAEGNPPL